VRVALVLFAALSTVGCGASVPLVRVDQLAAQCDAYKGKTIQLGGYLGMCAGYDCRLAADSARYDAWGSPLEPDAWRSLSPAAREKKRAAAMARMDTAWPIGIGGDQAFDRKAAPFQHSYVVITGQVDPESCTGQGGTDRSTGLHPTDIRAWTPSEGAPANTK